MCTGPGTLWLGHVCDLEVGECRISEVRVERCYAKIAQLQQIWPVVTARDVARVVGSLIS